MGTYMRARRSTLIFCGLFIFGLCVAGIAACADGDTAETLRGIILNSFEISAQSTLWTLWQKALIRNLCLLIFLYFCAYCAKGAIPASLAPVGIGLAVGARITVLLAQYGLEALKFCAIGIALPKTAEVLIFAGIYNLVLKAGKSGKMESQPQGVTFFVYALGLALQALLEAWLINIL